MKLKNLFLTLGVLSALPALARDFKYTYEGQTIIYTVIDEDAKTCMTKARGTTSDHISSAGNSVDGELILPSNPNDGDYDFTLTTIGEYSFFNNELTSVEIPNSVTEIGEAAFKDCRGLTSLEIPNSVISIGSRAFSRCSGVTSLVFNAENCEYCQAPFPSTIKNLVIGDMVTRIPTFAFRGLNKLTSVMIPNSVTEIGQYPFNECSSLVKAEFQSIESLMKIKFRGRDSNPLSIAHHLFIDGNEVTDLEIPETVTSICAYAFYGCSGLNSVAIPNSVTSIGGDAFGGCDGLIKAEFQSIESLLQIEFQGIDSNPLTIAHHLYIDGNEVTELDIPDTITSIGDYVFCGFSGLTSVVIPNSVTSIGDSAFEACIGLKSIEIPNSVTSIGWKAFMDCSGLTSVEIPNSVTSIRDYAFYGCNSLTSVTIPQSVNELYCPFPACENLKEIIVEDGNEYYVSEKGVLYNHDKTCIIQCPGGKSEYELPNTVTKIGQSAFYGCSGLTSMEISSSVTSIDLCAFFNCRGLTSVVIPSSVSELAWSAFYGCSSLTSVAIGCSITQIGPNTFINCPISNLYITVQTPPLMSSNPFNDYSCKLWLQGESALEKYKTAMTWKDFATTELMIEPTSMETDGLASLSGNAGDTFQLNARLIPENVTLPYIFWRSTNPQIATVDNNGLVTLQKYSAEDMNLTDGDEDNCGICRIIAETLYFDGPIAEFTIENTDFNAVESVTIGNDDSMDYSRPYDVYNMNGFKAGESTEGLPKGFYIIRQGKAAVKMVVK